jgi:hypothetical protein
MNIPLRIWNLLPVRFRTNIPSRFSPVGDLLTFPANAHYLLPDANGNFTKAMIETAVANGEKYIVFDAILLNIRYEESLFTVTNTWLAYLNLTIVGTELEPITLDFRKVYINCFPHATDIHKAHRVFNFEGSNHIITKFGRVEGDKFKRALVTTAEIWHESTQLLQSGAGTRNLTMDGGDIVGFMADTAAALPFGLPSIRGDEPDYFIQPDGRYESIFFNVNSTLYTDFGLMGGSGFNRLLKYDMEDVTFKFYNNSDVLIGQIVNAKYFLTYQFLPNTTKMKVNVRPTDGRTISPISFGHNLGYNPNGNTVFKNMKISDHHRGGIANAGNFAIIENIEFFNTHRNFNVPIFPDATRYHINCEDVVSRDLIIRNCSFRDKFHAILLTHNINADITNNVFTGINGGNNIFIYHLVNGNITGNTLNGLVNLGTGTNKSTVIATNNTGFAIMELSNGGEWFNNVFVGGRVRFKGKMRNNTLTNFNYDWITFTKEMHSNTFIGSGGATQVVIPGSYNFNNTFIGNTSFRIQNGTHLSPPVTWDGVTIDNSTTPSINALERNNSSHTVFVINSIFKAPKIRHETVNNPIDHIHGSWYFENTSFEDIVGHFLIIGTNINNTVPARFFFKNCTFTGSGNFISNTIFGGMLYEITLDNCTVAQTITLPVGIINATVVMPAIIEPRTQDIPRIRYEANVNRTILGVEYHIFTLMIRNKNTLAIILNEDVSNPYLHYNTTPDDFEYSIDGGLYWDSINA